MQSQQSTSPGKKESNADPISSTPNPVLTSIVQKYVTDAAEIISPSQASRRMFMVEVVKKCNEIARWETKTGKTSPEIPKTTLSDEEQSSTKLPQFVSYPNYSDGRFIPSGTNKVLDRLIDNYSMPKTSTAPSGSTSTGPSTTNTTAGSVEAAEASTSKTNESKPGNTFAGIGFNKSGSVLRKRIEEGHPNQAFTLFAPIIMPEDLTKIQFTLCNKIKTELQAVKKSVAAIPFPELRNKVTEATTNLEERICGLEDRYNELKEIILHRTAQHFTIDPSLLEKWDPTTMVLNMALGPT